MEEDWFLYSITLFTFAVIFFFCYIRHVYTFFEKNKIAKPKYPTFPFGNVSDVIFQKVPMGMVLWKLYLKFKKKKVPFGGFYIFTKPALVLSDGKSAKFLKHESLVQSEEVVQKVGESTWKIWGNLVENFANSESVNWSEVVSDKFLKIFMEECFGAGIGKNFGQGTFAKLMDLSYPTFANYFKKGENEEILNIIQNAGKNHIPQILLSEEVSRESLEKLVFMMVQNLIKCSNLILFALHEFSENEEIQEELRGEISRFQKQGSDFNFEEIEKLPYLETAICELLRKFPLCPFVHKFENLKNLHENANSSDISVFIPILAIHHDSQNFTNPQLFDPDRFSEENLKFINSDTYLPFGYKHQQQELEYRYVKIIIKVSLVQLLSKFKFGSTAKSPKNVELDPSFFDILRSKYEFYFSINKCT